MSNLALWRYLGPIATRSLLHCQWTFNASNLWQHNGAQTFLNSTLLQNTMAHAGGAHLFLGEAGSPNHPSRTGNHPNWKNSNLAQLYQDYIGPKTTISIPNPKVQRNPFYFQLMHIITRKQNYSQKLSYPIVFYIPPPSLTPFLSKPKLP